MTQPEQGQTFLTGLFGGALIGTAVGVLVAPRIYAAWRSLQRQVTEAAADICDAATKTNGRGVGDKAMGVVRAADFEDRAIGAQNDLSRRAAEAARGI